MLRDDAETVGLLEPLMVSEDSPHRAALNDLALDLAAQSAALRSSLPPTLTVSLANLIRSMNCYYSNLIEGHDTHPIDIERALQNDYSADPRKRDLQLEAKAHIAVQKWIDDAGMTEVPTSPVMIVETHRRFCDLLPPELLFVVNPTTGERVPVVPGELRSRDVVIGRHVAISPGAVPRFLQRFDQAYRAPGRVGSVLAAASAHHRLLWIHPFLDGNGRVARLMSYAILRNALDTGGLWSVARGLARNEMEYKQHLAACDGPRRGDRDGRGTLSEIALAEFTRFFLRVSIDQVEFITSLMRPDTLRDRILGWATEKIKAGALPIKSDNVMRALLYHGELQRAEIPAILGLGERGARRVTSALIESGAVASDSSRAPVRLVFPATLAGRWMPGLFPDAPGLSR